MASPEKPTTAAFHPFGVHPWLGDDEGVSKRPEQGRITAPGDRALLGSEPLQDVVALELSLAIMGDRVEQEEREEAACAATAVAVPPVSASEWGTTELLFAPVDTRLALQDLDTITAVCGSRSGQVVFIAETLYRNCSGCTDPEW